MATTIAFPNMFNISTGSTQLATGMLANQQCMKCILLTSVGELLGDPFFGSNVKRYLFEIQSEYYAELLKQSIQDSVHRYTQDVVIRAIRLNTSEYDKTKIKISIVYTLRRQSDYEFSVDLELSTDLT